MEGWDGGLAREDWMFLLLVNRALTDGSDPHHCGCSSVRVDKKKSETETFLRGGGGERGVQFVPP